MYCFCSITYGSAIPSHLDQLWTKILALNPENAWADIIVCRKMSDGYQLITATSSGSKLEKELQLNDIDGLKEQLNDLSQDQVVIIRIFDKHTLLKL